MRKWLIGAVYVLGLVGCLAWFSPVMVMAAEGECTSILNQDWCENGEAGIWGLLMLVINILTAGIGIAATIGIVIAAIQYLTARDDPSYVAKAKSRIFNIVLGLAVYAVMWALLNWLIPGGLFNSIGGGA